MQPVQPVDHAAELRRRALVFAGLALLVLVVVIALPESVATPKLDAWLRRAMQNHWTTRSSVDWSVAPGLVCLGFCAGLMGGMLGLGGGVLHVHGLLLVGQADIFFSRAVTMGTMFLTAASALWPYAKRGWVRWSAAKPMLLPGLACCVAGVLVGHYAGGTFLTYFFCLFTLFLGLFTLAEVLGDPDEHTVTAELVRRRGKTRRRLGQIIGAVTGLLAGMLGITGGVVATPMQQMLLRVPFRSAVGSTLLLATVLTGLGSMMVIALGLLSNQFPVEPVLLVLGTMGTGSVVGAQVGAKLAGRASSALLRLLFVAVTVACAVSILLRLR